MNSKWHLNISFIKSGVRIVACGGSLILGQWILLAIGLLLAEILGIHGKIKTLSDPTYIKLQKLRELEGE